MADQPRWDGAMLASDVTRTYENECIRVLWDATRCIHTGNCLRGLPSVFDREARPWVDLSGADADEIAATVRTCPSGALRYDGRNVEPEVPDVVTTVEVRPNGPLHVRGRLRLQRPGGVGARDEVRAALCRCGASGNKPYCDNSHRRVHFEDGGTALP